MNTRNERNFNIIRSNNPAHRRNLYKAIATSAPRPPQPASFTAGGVSASHSRSGSTAHGEFQESRIKPPREGRRKNLLSFLSKLPIHPDGQLSRRSGQNPASRPYQYHTSPPPPLSNLFSPFFPPSRIPQYIPSTNPQDILR
jgi:hypothetical protein